MRSSMWTSVGSMDRLALESLALESLALVAAPAMSGAATFMPFVDLAGGANYSIANAISADGTWVAGCPEALEPGTDDPEAGFCGPKSPGRSDGKGQRSMMRASCP